MARLITAELAAQSKRPGTVARRSSRGFLTSRPSGPLVPTLGTNVAPGSSFPPVGQNAELASTPPFAVPGSSKLIYGSSPRSRPPIPAFSASPRGLSYANSPLGAAAAAASQVPAIAKAIGIASLRLIGNPADGIILRRRPVRKPISRSSSQIVDKAELQILSEIEDLAQKASVVADFADARLLQLLPPTPQVSTGTTYFPTAAATSPFAPSTRRSSGSSSDRPSVSTPTPTVAQRPDLLAADALVLYVRALVFLQRGIERTTAFWSSRPADQSVSGDFNDGASCN